MVEMISVSILVFVIMCFGNSHEFGKCSLKSKFGWLVIYFMGAFVGAMFFISVSALIHGWFPQIPCGMWTE